MNSLCWLPVVLARACAAVSTLVVIQSGYIDPRGHGSLVCARMAGSGEGLATRGSSQIP